MYNFQSKVYAVMEYHDQPLEYINRCYFHIKTAEDEHYDIIQTIMSMMAVLPISIFWAFFIIAIRYILPMITALLIKLSKTKLKEVKSEMEQFKQSQSQNLNVRTILESDQQEVYLIKVLICSDNAEKIADMENKNTEYAQQILKESSNEYNFYIINLLGIIHSKWEVSEKSLFLLSIIINVTLIAFHIVSGVKLIMYGDAILKDSKDSDEDHSSVPILHLAFSLFIIIIAYIPFYNINLYFKISDQ